MARPQSHGVGRARPAGGIWAAGTRNTGACGAPNMVWQASILIRSGEKKSLGYMRERIKHGTQLLPRFLGERGPFSIFLFWLSARPPATSLKPATHVSPIVTFREAAIHLGYCLQAHWRPALWSAEPHDFHQCCVLVLFGA